MFRSNGGVKEAVSGTGIYEGTDWSSWNKVAHRFFDSELDLASEVLSVMVAEQPLAAEDVALEQSFTTCPPFLQKRHRFWLKWCWHSCWVSLLSFPSLEERSELGFFWLELPELAFPVVFEVLELLELFLLLLLLFLFLSEFEVVLLVLVPLPFSLEHSGFGAVRVSLATLEWCEVCLRYFTKSPCATVFMQTVCMGILSYSTLWLKPLSSGYPTIHTITPKTL